jgi:hypothetical protein
MKVNDTHAVLAALKRQTKNNTKDKKAASAALLRMGIINSKGNVTKKYARDPRSKGMVRA